MSQSVLRNVRQQDRRESVDEFSPASRLRTAFREIPLLSANVCCDRLSANLNALRLLPSVFSISSLVLYTITCLIRIKIGYIVAQHSLKGQYRLYNVRRVTSASVEAYVAHCLPCAAFQGLLSRRHDLRSHGRRSRGALLICELRIWRGSEPTNYAVGVYLPELEYVLKPMRISRTGLTSITPSRSVSNP